QTFSAPAAITEAFPAERWTFVGWATADIPRGRNDVRADDGALTPAGQLPVDLPTDAAAGVPYAYTLEGDVEDVSRQHIANRASLVVHPAPWDIGVRTISTFNDQKDGLKTELIVVGLDGKPVPGVAVDVTLTQVQWNSVRRAEGNGFYTWETERKDVPAGTWHVTSGAAPVALQVPLRDSRAFTLSTR